mmetsp:Transcript_84326/g.272989  ORF Transcript_84326/g.272989 Transcript_84326/m.272989 type:complete len:224 (+) Transcript_84326:166-837(+)
MSLCGFRLTSARKISSLRMCRSTASNVGWDASFASVASGCSCSFNFVAHSMALETSEPADAVEAAPLTCEFFGGPGPPSRSVRGAEPYSILPGRLRLRRQRQKPPRRFFSPSASRVLPPAAAALLPAGAALGGTAGAPASTAGVAGTAATPAPPSASPAAASLDGSAAAAPPQPLGGSGCWLGSGGPALHWGPELLVLGLEAFTGLFKSDVTGRCPTGDTGGG